MQLLHKHDFILKLIAEENQAQLKAEYLATGQVSPLPLLNLELLIIERGIELLQMKEGIYHQYIETLDNIDALRLENNVNYLDERAATIE